MYWKQNLIKNGIGGVHIPEKNDLVKAYTPYTQHNTQQKELHTIIIYIPSKAKAFLICKTEVKYVTLLHLPGDRKSHVQCNYIWCENFSHILVVIVEFMS